MTPKQIASVQESWAKARPNADTVGLETFVSLLAENSNHNTLVPLCSGIKGNTLIKKFDQLVTELAAPEAVALHIDSFMKVLVQSLTKNEYQPASYLHDDDNYQQLSQLILTSVEACLEKPFTVAVKRAWQAVAKSLVQVSIGKPPSPTQRSSKRSYSYFRG